MSIEQGDFFEFPSSGMLVAALATRISDLLRDGIHRRGRASLAVSGGSTPIPLFARLAEMDLQWNKVTVSLVDERWVEPEARDSNENLVRTWLLRYKAAAARFIPMKTRDATVVQGEEACAILQREIPLPYDCLILGMGNDGHTASLFPGAKNLEAAVDLHSGKICMAIQPPAAPYERMTLTLPAILNSRQLFLHLQGEEKKKVLARAREEGDAREMPVRFILRQETTPLAVYWSP
ncbi:MAG: 6-phosphogluconolactonase [Deltaproteobacteria bacterium]|nr:6-phosphogluconolactonase [Deltaproteobacteria bacterium]